MDLQTLQMISHTVIAGGTCDLEFFMYDGFINELLKNIDKQYTHEECPEKLRYLKSLVIVIEKIHYLIWFLALKNYNIVYAMDKDYVQKTNNNLFPIIQEDIVLPDEFTASNQYDINLNHWKLILFDLAAKAFPSNSLETKTLKLESPTFKTNIIAHYFSQKQTMIQKGEILTEIEC